jgi:hypothetical protein
MEKQENNSIEYTQIKLDKNCKYVIHRMIFLDSWGATDIYFSTGLTY